jgi:DNA-binding XRE family transcriptional regulator
MTDFKLLRERALRDPIIKAEYDRLGPIYEVVGAMIEARHDEGLTQKEVADRMGTTQSAIARLENARQLPSLAFVTRYATAIGRKVDLHLIK